MIELTAFFVTFVRVFARAFQQKNVIGNHYFAVIPTSYFMGALEVWIVTIIVVEGFSFPLIFAIGSGGWMGAVLAMILHGKFFGTEKNTFRRNGRAYIDSINTCAHSETRVGLDGIRKYYRTDLNEIRRALDALWRQINGRA